jgi:spore germination protein YaaH
MKLIKSIFLLIAFNISSGKAQDKFKSILQEESEKYAIFSSFSDAQFDSLRNAPTLPSKINSNENACTLNKVVFGWHPYWNGTVYNNYQWNLISDLCYFNYDVSPSTGNNVNGSFAWATSSAVTVAQNNGTKIHICATMFSGHSTFWGSVSAQNTFISNMVSLLNSRNGNGINIDFEGMGASDKVPFANFITNLKTALVSANPNYKLSVCLYAVEWSSTFDFSILNNSVDLYTIMGYDYYYSGSAQAGPTSPLYNFQTGYNYTIAKSITYYLKQGVPNSKLALGLPYYGREWEVTGTGVPANTTGNFNSSRTLSYINNNPSTYTLTNKFWEGNCYSPLYKTTVGANDHQCFIDDVYSLGRKYDLVNQRGIAGIGIWALGYDDGMTSYWNLIKDKFTDCAPIICSDSLFDMGGPARNYYDNEKYFYTLSAPTGSLVQLQFKSFGTELNYDSLWIYNGTSTLSPLIGSYTGTNSPGTVTSSAQSLTLRFKSDGATNSFGFKVIKNCLTQVVPTFVNENSFSSIIKMFPNPNSGNLFFETSEELSVRLSDVQSKMIREYEITPSKNSIDLTELKLPNGIYLVNVQTSSGNSFTQKLIYIN